MENIRKNRPSLARMFRATKYSIEGLKSAYAGEQAFRDEIWLCMVLAPLGLWLGKTWVETVLLLGSLMLVLIVELLNSAIEATVDRVSLELHDLSKRAKDLASAAVMLSVLFCSGVWITALCSRLLGV